MWWEQATDRQKDNLKYLYNNGQVEFLIGGIVMNDEAAATYEAIINQVISPFSSSSFLLFIFFFILFKLFFFN